MKPPRKTGRDSLILLKDLVPRKDPKGGASTKTVFGELPPVPEPIDRDPPAAKPKRKK